MTDQDETTTPEETSEENSSEETQETKTFSQEEVNALLASEKRKIQSRYEGFDDYKNRATEADELKGQNSELLSRAEAAELKAVRLEVAQETGVPASALTATDEESMRKQAEDLKAWRGESSGVKREAETSGNSTGSALDAKGRAAEALRRLR